MDDKTRSWLSACLIGSMAAAMGAGADAGDATPPPAALEQKPELAGILRHVPKLKHPFPAGWHSTLYWWGTPLTFDNPAKLKEELQALADRGLSPCIGLDAEYNVDSARIDQEVTQAKAMADAGFPVNIQMLGALDLYHLPDGKLVCHADSTDAGKKDAVGGEFPCIILKDGWKARGEHVNGLLKKFADAKVPVAAVWYDYEGHPHPWNGIFEHSQKCPACAKEFPAGVLADRNRFAAWVFDLHPEALVTAFAKPVRDNFPKALIGFYGYTVSSKAHTYTDWCGVCYPPSGVKPAEIDVVMPVCYANTSAVRKYFNADWPVTGEAMDAIYFAALLRAASNLHDNIRPNQTVMPFVSSWVSGPGDEKVPRMSKSLYQEFLRHAILRGAKGFYCFNVAPPYGPMADYYTELADINAVYNELFAYKEFLEGGAPLNDAWPDPKDLGAVVWSGLQKGDKALVRVLALGDTPKFVDVVPFPGVVARVLASPTGTTYIVERSGRCETVE